MCVRTVLSPVFALAFTLVLALATSAYAQEEPHHVAPLEQGRIAEQQGRPDDAARHYGEAIEGARLAGDTRTERLALCALGRLRSSRGQLDEAVAALREAIPLADGAVERAAPATVRLMLTDVYLAHGQVVDALPWADAAVRAAVASSPVDDALEDPLVAAACATYVRITRMLGDDRPTRVATGAHLEDLLAPLEEPGGVVPQLLFVHGVALLQGGELERALLTLEDALALADATSADVDRGGLLAGIAYTALELGDEDRARSAFEAGLQHPGAARVALLSGLALLEARQGWHDRAFARFDEALAAAGRAGQPLERGEVLASRASLHEERGDFDEARRLLDDASALVAEHGPAREEALVRARLARVAARQHRWAEAEMEALRSLARNRNPHDRAGGAPRYGSVDAGVLALVVLAEVHQADEELDEARTALRQALQMLVQDGRPDAAARIAAAQGFVDLERGEPARGLETFETLRTAVSEGELQRHWVYDHGAALCQWRLGDLDAAERSLWRAIEPIEEAEAEPGRVPLVWLPRPGAPFMALTTLLLDQDRDDEAFVVTARARARSGALLVSAGSLQDRLDARSAALVYLVGEDQTVAWVVTEDWVTPVRWPTGQRAIERAVVALLDQLRQPPQHGRRSGEAWRAPAARLYDLVLRPLAGEVGHVDRLLLLPDGPLAHVPFAALDDGEQLVAQRYATSVLVGVEPAGPLPSLGRRAPALVVGDPGATTPIGESAEMAAVQAHCRKAEALDLEGATEEAVRQRLAGLELLHLATAVEYNGARPDASGIRLDESASHDGLWTVHEIETAGPGPAIVALTGCPSEPLPGVDADLEVERPEAAAMVLARAFTAAGAEAVVIDLWPVDDAARHAVFREVYGGLGEQGVARALGAAQAAMAADAVHPYHWATWIVVE